MLVEFTTPTQPAGSIGGLVLYKNGDNFAGRSRVYPKRVRSNEHTAAMNLISTLSERWEIPLTNSQRAAWGTYAYNTPLTDAYAQPRYIRGYAHYLRSNRPRLQHGLSRIDNGPTTYGLPAYTLPTFSPNFTTLEVTVTVNPADQWATQSDAAMLLWISRPTQRARKRPPETYRPLGAILGDPTTPPTTATFPLNGWFRNIPQIFWIRSSVTDAEGRLSGL